MNYLVKGITAFLTTSFIFRVLKILFQSNLIDFMSAVATGSCLIIIGFSLYFIWHSNPSMNTNIINFIGIVGLFGVLLGLLF